LYHYIIPYKYAEKYLNNIGSDDEIKLQKINGLVEYANRNNAHDKAEYIDKIPNLGNIIAKCGKDLKLEGQSRTYGRWKKKESIGRATLGKYIKVFENEDKEKIIQREINILKQAYNNNVRWDEIVEIKNIDDPKEYVYDFTVPGNQTFLTGDGIIVHNTLNTFHATGSGTKAMQGVKCIMNYNTISS
jgi:intein/homing endonuclease